MNNLTTQIFKFTGDGLQPLEEKKILPLYCLVHSFGFGMSECLGAVIEEKEGRQKCVSLGSYEPHFFYADKYSEPLSKKFGIGVYYSDSFELAERSNVEAAIIRATEADAQRLQSANDKDAADAAEKIKLPSMFPHLVPVSLGGECIKNIRLDLKKYFPHIKFSVSRRGGGSSAININWTDGATVKQVEEITSKYTDHASDWSGDFRDYNPSNFNRVFGGENYIFENRGWSEPTRLIFEGWAEKMYNEGRKFNTHTSGNLAYRLFAQCECYTGFEIVETGANGGVYEPHTFYTTVNKAQTEATTVESISADGVTLIDYSEKAVAVVGNTKPIKDKLKELGGRFNFALSVNGEKVCGWIFPKTKSEQIKLSLSL